jgi:hypothetical protein
VASGLEFLPEHMRGGHIGRSNPQLLPPPLKAPHKSEPVYLTVPLDHFGPAGGKTMQLHYFLSNSSYKGGPLFVKMAGEGSVNGCYTDQITANFKGLSICPEHRFFGETSVPSNDSSTAGLKYLSVEQNLADVKAIVDHVKLDPKYKDSPVVALGGSYSGASAAWVRLRYPETITAAIAESGPVEATLDVSTARHTCSIHSHIASATASYTVCEYSTPYLHTHT